MFNTSHAYSVAVVGLKRSRIKLFMSRPAANQYMYSLCRKHKLTIQEIWNDHHDKTYKCDNGVIFYIQRA